jgi:TMEM175 potassium channel family protein
MRWTRGTRRYAPRVSEATEVDLAAAERMTFFSDAVVAIAITLLAIELPVPSGATDEELVAALREGWFEYLAFLISFWVIAHQWMAHHRVFRYVRRADAPLIGLNLFWLLLVVITPFLTKVITEGELTFLRFVMYAAAQAVQMGTFAVMIAVLTRRGWFAPAAPRSLTDRGWVNSVVGASGFLLSLPCFLVVGAWAFAVWALVPAVGGRLLARAGVIVTD